MSIRSLIASALIVLFVASTAGAQAPEVSWQGYAQRLGPRSLVVVELVDGRRIEGHIIQVTDEAVMVLPKTRIRVPVRRLEYANIQSIEVRKDGWSPGAKVLTAVGSVAGAMSVIVIAMLAGSR